MNVILDVNVNKNQTVLDTTWIRKLADVHLEFKYGARGRPIAVYFACNYDKNGFIYSPVAVRYEDDTFTNAGILEKCTTNRAVVIKATKTTLEIVLKT